MVVKFFHSRFQLGYPLGSFDSCGTRDDDVNRKFIENIAPVRGFRVWRNFFRVDRFRSGRLVAFTEPLIRFDGAFQFQYFLPADEFFSGNFQESRISFEGWSKQNVRLGNESVTRGRVPVHEYEIYSGTRADLVRAARNVGRQYIIIILDKARERWSRWVLRVRRWRLFPKRKILPNIPVCCVFHPRKYIAVAGPLNNVLIRLHIARASEAQKQKNANRFARFFSSFCSTAAKKCLLRSAAFTAPMVGNITLTFMVGRSRFNYWFPSLKLFFSLPLHNRINNNNISGVAPSRFFECIGRWTPDSSERRSSFSITKMISLRLLLASYLSSYHFPQRFVPWWGVGRKCLRRAMPSENHCKAMNVELAFVARVLFIVARLRLGSGPIGDLNCWSIFQNVTYLL